MVIPNEDQLIKHNLYNRYTMSALNSYGIHAIPLLRLFSVSRDLPAHYASVKLRVNYQVALIKV